MSYWCSTFADRRAICLVHIDQVFSTIQSYSYQNFYSRIALPPYNLVSPLEDAGVSYSWHAWLPSSRKTGVDLSGYTRGGVNPTLHILDKLNCIMIPWILKVRILFVMQTFFTVIFCSLYHTSRRIQSCLRAKTHTWMQVTHF